MGKIFVHKPLKRREVRRLAEPAEPREAAPGPSVSQEEARTLAKLEALRAEFRLARARKRAEQRNHERAVEEAIECFTRASLPLVIDGDAFVRWILETMATVEDEAGFAGFVRTHNLLTLTSRIRCLRCGAPEPAGAGDCSIILFTGLSKRQPDVVVAGVACRGCKGAKPRYYARMVVGMVTGEAEVEEAANKRLRKLTLLEGDWDLLRWLEQPRLGDDARAVRKMARAAAWATGFFFPKEELAVRSTGCGDNFGKTPTFGKVE